MILPGTQPVTLVRRWWPVAAAAAGGVLLALLPLPYAAALLVGVPLLLLMLREPLAGIGLALIAGPWGAVESLVWGAGPLDSGQLLLLITAGAWLLRGLGQRRINVPAVPLLAPLAPLLLAATLSLLDAPSPVLGAIELLKWLEIGLLLVLVVDLTTEVDAGGTRRVVTGRFWLVVAFLLLAAASQAAIGVWQFVLRGDGPDHFLIRPGLYRAAGTFQQPNPFGGYMQLSALLAAGVAVGLLTPLVRRLWHARQETPRRDSLPWASVPAVLVVLAAGAVTGLLLGGLVASWSRGAWLGFAAGAAVMAFFWTPRRWQGVALLAGGLLAVAVAWQAGLIPAPLADRLLGWTADFRLSDVRGVDITDANFAVIERLAHWQAALAMAREQIWLGVGFGNYEAAYGAHALLNWPNALGHAHNYYLNLLAEIGALGLVAYLLFWATVFGVTLRVLPRLAWPQRGVALGLLGVWTALSVHHLLDKLFVNNLYLHVGVLLALLQLLTMMRNEHAADPGSTPAAG